MPRMHVHLEEYSRASVRLLRLLPGEGQGIMKGIERVLSSAPGASAELRFAAALGADALDASRAGDPEAHRWLEHCAPAWHTENAADITVSDATIAVELKAQTLPIIVKVSRELFEDAQNLDQAVRQSIAGALALELDRVALYGTGTDPEPLGIVNTPGIQTVIMGANGANLGNYEPILDAIGNIWEANHEPNAGIMAPRTKTTIAKLMTADCQPAMPPPVVDTLAWYATNQVKINETQGTATNASSVFVGQWNQLIIGMRTGFTIELLRERYVDNWQYAFAAHLRADVQLIDPAAFCVVQGIVPA